MFSFNNKPLSLVRVDFNSIKQVKKLLEDERITMGHMKNLVKQYHPPAKINHYAGHSACPEVQEIRRQINQNQREKRTQLLINLEQDQQLHYNNNNQSFPPLPSTSIQQKQHKNDRNNIYIENILTSLSNKIEYRLQQFEDRLINQVIEVEKIMDKLKSTTSELEAFIFETILPSIKPIQECSFINTRSTATREDLIKYKNDVANVYRNFSYDIFTNKGTNSHGGVVLAADRTITLDYQGHLSKQVKVNRGTPQGSCFGPKTYIVNHFDLPSIFDCPSEVHLYVDDLAILFSPSIYLKYAQQVDEIETRINKDLLKLANYAESNHQPIYNKKTDTWLRDEDSPVLVRLSQLISALTNLTMETAEEVHVVNYGVGGYYSPHVDFYHKWENPAYFRKAGNRIATWMTYMSDVEWGGATVFPLSGGHIVPKKGSTVFWYNLNASGEGRPTTEHYMQVSIV
ncbi:unnamed protein product [Rotaria magnacalcarata]|uniref:Prolyl 4-hydroxylase alpha subunit domain-containing protein n=1 Tax=Rotaria magnacalcarata TaxID=392030 RepID=A0A8S2KC50_9BILA|nr:unnamed protein product [Rotaria magnacalcarata]